MKLVLSLYPEDDCGYNRNVGSAKKNKQSIDKTIPIIPNSCTTAFTLPKGTARYFIFVIVDIVNVSLTVGEKSWVDAFRD